MIRPERIAHVVIKVRDLERSKKFYTEVLGMQVMKDTPEIKGAVFLANHTRDHHEIALFQIGPDAELPRPDQAGLAHIAFRLRSEAKNSKPPMKSSRRRDVPVNFTVNPRDNQEHLLSSTRTETSWKSTATTP